jgi:predicted alpha/beta-hydrolase family hydrolase
VGTTHAVAAGGDTAAEAEGARGVKRQRTEDEEPETNRQDADTVLISSISDQYKEGVRGSLSLCARSGGGVVVVVVVMMELTTPPFSPRRCGL